MDELQAETAAEAILAQARAERKWRRRPKRSLPLVPFTQRERCLMALLGLAGTLLLSDGSKLEFFTPGSPGHAKAAQVRLISAVGTTLHTATYPGSVASRSLDYLVCEGKVTYISPAPSVVPSCGQ